MQGGGGGGGGGTTGDAAGTGGPEGATKGKGGGEEKENLLGWRSGEYFQSSSMFSKTTLTCFDYELELSIKRNSVECRISNKESSLKGSN